MTRSRLAFLAATPLVFAAFTATAGEPELKPGAYEVAYRLELPHIESRDETVVRVCLGDAALTGLPVLSANNPLAHCPVKNVRRDGRELLFDIVCPGGNTAKAYALFDLRADAFEGRIAMNMGGKNMTMTEVQRGRRVADCDADGKPLTN